MAVFLGLGGVVAAADGSPGRFGGREAYQNLNSIPTGQDPWEIPKRTA